MHNVSTFLYIMADAKERKFGITNNIPKRERWYQKRRPTLEMKYYT